DSARGVALQRHARCRSQQRACATVLRGDTAVWASVSQATWGSLAASTSRSAGWEQPAAKSRVGVYDLLASLQTSLAEHGGELTCGDLLAFKYAARIDW